MKIYELFVVQQIIRSLSIQILLSIDVINKSFGKQKRNKENTLNEKYGEPKEVMKSI